MDDQDIQVFIAGVRRYFDSLRADERVVIEPPFIKDEERPLLEYTGIIGISGKAHGAVFFTANGLMLTNILGFLNESPSSREMLCDLVGEIANTLSGNAREEFGSDFLISVPVVATEGDCGFSFPEEGRNYVMPIIWRSEKAYLLVCLR
ncbi:MAG TPA: chemotaxis protein CheX [Chthoniobacterales bacterium]